MEYGYKLNIPDGFETKYIEKGKELGQVNELKIYNGLDKLIGLDGDISGSKIQSEWFPQVEVDIFLSHSHNDEELALGLVGFLKEKFDLNVFIDSNVWKSADRLLKIIDEKHCGNGFGHYDYERRNLSTSHVHMVLAVSLAKMINRSKALFVLNTPNVITTLETIEKTNSPWIYFELVMAELLRKEGDLEKKGAVTEAAQSIPISHEINTDNLYQLTKQDLELWVQKNNEYFKRVDRFSTIDSQKTSKQPLDILLDLVKEKEGILN